MTYRLGMHIVALVGALVLFRGGYLHWQEYHHEVAMTLEAIDDLHFRHRTSKAISGTMHYQAGEWQTTDRWRYNHPLRWRVDDPPRPTIAQAREAANELLGTAALWVASADHQRWTRAEEVPSIWRYLQPGLILLGIAALLALADRYRRTGTGKYEAKNSTADGVATASSRVTATADGPPL